MNGREGLNGREQQRRPCGSCCIYDRGQGGEEGREVLKSSCNEVPSGTSCLLVRVARRPEPNADVEQQMFSSLQHLEVEERLPRDN